MAVPAFKFSLSMIPASLDPTLCLPLMIHRAGFGTGLPPVEVGSMPVMPTAAGSSIVKGKVRNNRPSPPSGIIRSRWWGRVIPDPGCRRRTTDFFNGLLYQRSILPNPLSHFLTIGIIGFFGNGLNGMSVFIIINHRLAMLSCISGCLVILIYCISD